MKMREITESASVGGTSAGGITTVSQPMGEVITREQKPRTTKYVNSAPSKVAQRRSNAKR